MEERSGCSMLALITEQPRCDASEQFTFCQPILNQAGVNVDRARQCDAVDRQLLFVDAISRQTGEQNSDERDKTNNEPKPNHSRTQKMRSWRRNICRPPGRQRTETGREPTIGDNEAAIIGTQQRLATKINMVAMSAVMANPGRC